MALAVGKRAVYSLTKGDGSIDFTKLGEVNCGGILSAASASRDLLYYVSEEAPDTVMQWSSKSERDTLFVKLPSPVKKLVFYRNKVYCAPEEGTCIICIDPLNLSVERLNTHHNFINFEPASHGFVVGDSMGTLYGYHFNHGSCKVVGVTAAELIGRYKRFGVAITPGKGGPVGVSENGEIAQPPTVPSNVSEGFVTVEDDVFVYRKKKNTIETLDGLSEYQLPNSVTEEGSILLLSVPELENEEVCTLCLCEFDGNGDGITLDCGHRFHKDCVLDWARRWDEFKAKGNHITFTNAVCPGGCKHLVRHPLLGDLSQSILSMFQKVTLLTKRILPSMGSTKLDEDLLFYVCNICGKPFYGGEKVCFRMQGAEPAKDPTELLCEGCQSDFSCPCHGRDFAVYKCSYCCNPATERSFGNRYLCGRCGARWTSNTQPDCIPCPGSTHCPLGGDSHVEHKAYPIGCLACLAGKAIDYDKIVAAPSIKEPHSQ